MQSEDSMQSQKFNINLVQLPGYLSNSKKVMWSPYCSRTRYFELIALGMPYAVYKSNVEIWLGQPAVVISISTCLPCKFKLHVPDFIMAKKKAF